MRPPTEVTPPPTGTGDAHAVASGAVGRSMALTSLATIPTLAVNLATGILTARLLAPAGRGEVAAVVAWVLVLDLVMSLGAREASTYLQAKGQHAARHIMGTALLLSVVLGVLGVVVAELLLPVALAAQSDELLRLARWAMLMLVPAMLAGTGYALLNGHQRFGGAAIYRLCQPGLVLLGLVALWVLGRVTVASVLTVHGVSWVLMLAVVGWLLRHDLEVGRPTVAATRATLGYGVRLHGQQLGTLANARLDVMVMPALLAPAQIGLYVVAANAASLVMPLFAQVRSIVFSAGAREDRGRSVDITVRALRFTLLGSAATAAALGLVAPVAIEVVYGGDFQAAARPLRILLPGIVAWAGAAVLTSGLNAVGRPGVGSVAQLVGAAFTVVGLAVTLPLMGIDGAALTSSVSYTAVFVVLVRAMRREAGFSLRAALSVRGFLTDLRGLVHGIRRRRAGTAAGTPEAQERAPSAVR
jgi:enterobacterial common antigen flippase